MFLGHLLPKILNGIKLITKQRATTTNCKQNSYVVFICMYAKYLKVLNFFLIHKIHKNKCD